MNLYLVCTLLIGLMVGFYWARVLKLVRKTRKKTGQSAQLLPREPLGRALRIVWYPTVVVWVAHPWITLGAHFTGTTLPGVLTPLWTSGYAAVPATVVALLALWGTLICWRKMGTSWRMGINPGEKTSLIVSGPYSYVAHPIYALQQVLVLASAAVVASPVMLGVAVIELVFLQWEARREERYLVEVHGEVYARYNRSVGRFVPRSLRPFVA
jgi:protein-S-isoprenylcysteine O-methyltransferase Ste14